MGIPDNITREHILRALDEINKLGIIKRRSKNYCLAHGNRHYPPKYVISIANIFANGFKLDSRRFNGGECPTCANFFLRKRGFDVVGCGCKNTKGWMPKEKPFLIKERSGAISEISEAELINNIKTVAESEGYYVDVRKNIIITSREYTMRYEPDLALKRSISSHTPDIIIQVEGVDKARKVLMAEIVLAGLVGAKHFIPIARDRLTAEYVKRYGSILTDKIEEIKGMKVSPIFESNKKELERVLKEIIGRIEFAGSRSKKLKNTYNGLLKNKMGKERNKQLLIEPPVPVKELIKILKKQQRVDKYQLYDWNSGEVPWWKKRGKYGGRRGRS